MIESQPRDAATPLVSAFYDRFPYPGDPLQDGPPPGYNWRWSIADVRCALDGAIPPPPRRWRILDAGCGTGVSTDYLCHLNPGSQLLAVDISAGALQVARERIRRSGAAAQVTSLRIEQRSLLDLEQEGLFDHINSVGVLHHLRQPEAGLQALAERLAPGGVLHLFLYADGGRWEIQRTQQALTLLGAAGDAEGLRLGRALLAGLPEHNRLRRHHQQRWALDTAADANFADMYLHPQETSYNLERLFRFIARAGLRFAGFSNPAVWDPARLLEGELLERARALPSQQRWALVEALDPDISHFEFFLRRQSAAHDQGAALPDPAPASPQALDDASLLALGGERSRCLWGWPSTALMGADLEPLEISPEDVELLQALDQAPAGAPIGGLPLAMDAAERAARVRRLAGLRVLLPVRTGDGSIPPA